VDSDEREGGDYLCERGEGHGELPKPFSKWILLNLVMVTAHVTVGMPVGDYFCNQREAPLRSATNNVNILDPSGQSSEIR
jgi:hypothetical protein